MASLLGTFHLHAGEVSAEAGKWYATEIYKGFGRFRCQTHSAINSRRVWFDDSE